MASALFALPSLDLHVHEARNKVPSLPGFDTELRLPQLDEYGAGQDRMLAGLEATWWWDVRSEGPRVSSSAKEKVGTQPVLPLDGALKSGRATSEPENAAMPTAAYLLDVAERMGCEAGPSRPRVFRPLRTLDIHDQEVRESPFVSDGGGRLFEAITAIADPQLSLPHLRSRPRPPPAEPAALLDLLIQATLGTTSTSSLLWDKQTARYTWGSSGERVSGLSHAASASTVADLLNIATALRRLDALLDRHTTGLFTPTHHALFHAVSTYLSFIKDRLSTAISEKQQDAVQDWIKWNTRLRDVRQLLETLLGVMNWPLTERQAMPLPARASSLLSHLYSHLIAQHQSDSPVTGASSLTLCLAYLLQRASVPFMALLHAWVGLADTSAEDVSTSVADQPWADLGITRKARSVRHGAIGEALWDYDFSSRRMPAFVPKDTRRRLFEAGRSLRLLIEAKEDHPLSGGGWELHASWGWGEEFNDVHHEVLRHVKRVRREMEQWSRSVRQRSRPLSGTASMGKLRGSGKQRKRIPADFINQSVQSTASKPDVATLRGAIHDLDLTDPAPAGTNVEDQFAAFLASLSVAPGSVQQASVWSATPLDSLQAFLGYQDQRPLLPPAFPTFDLFVSHQLLAPLLTHGELVSKALVQLYLDELHLLDHLDVLHAFWLGGDVGFSERVSSALFGTEDQAADRGISMGRRARTRARMGLTSVSAGGAPRDNGEWGIALGVGLSDRQRWPPGGAELAYALRTTLIDDAGGYAGDKRAGIVWDDIEDRVSFAIRALPEDQDGTRAKWMDPQAVEALDFLYLSYSPPQVMSVVLPRDILAKYQKIHNFLLRLCRVSAVVRSIYYDLNKPYDEVADDDGKTGVDAHRKRRSGRTRDVRVRRTMLSLDPALEGLVQRLQFRMSHFVSAVMRYVVDTAIGTNWARMRRRLDRLRRRDDGPGPDSRPLSPAEDHFSVSDLDDQVEHADDEDLANNDVNDDPEPIHQLKSVHSLVAYQHLTLDRIMRACLLGSSAGYEVTYKLLMRLCGLILDLGKVVKEIEERMEDLGQSASKIHQIRKEWDEKEATFMKALERLALKGSKRLDGDTDVDEGVEAQDLEMLMQDEADEQGSANARLRGTSELQELLIRLQFGNGADQVRRGRSDDDL